MSKLISNNSISAITQFSYVWPIKRNLPGSTTPGKSGPKSDGDGGGVHVP